MGGQSKRLHAWRGLGLGPRQSSSLTLSVWLLSGDGRRMHATERVIRPTPQVAEQEVHRPASHLQTERQTNEVGRGGVIFMVTPAVAYYERRNEKVVLNLLQRDRISGKGKNGKHSIYLILGCRFPSGEERLKFVLLNMGRRGGKEP